MENIIKKAIEGGWKPVNWENDFDYLKLRIDTYHNNAEFYKDIDLRGSHMVWQITEFVCDPLFWQALGNMCGWDGKLFKFRECWGCNTRETERGHIQCDCLYKQNDWQYQALKFHEINLTQGWDLAVRYLRELIEK